MRPLSTSVRQFTKTVMSQSGAAVRLSEGQNVQSGFIDRKSLFLRYIVRMKIALMVFLACLGSLCLSVKASDARTLPKTVDEAVAQLKSELSPQDRDHILRMSREDLALLHMSLGLRIRNGFGLWSGNEKLMRSCGVKHPDACSGIIIYRLWEAVRADADPGLVKQLDCQFQLAEAVQINYAKFDQFTTGQLLNALQDQIDAQISRMQASGTPMCQSSLKLGVLGDPQKDCFVRAEFAREETKKEVSLDRLFGWISWRNEFEVLNEPPEIRLTFRKTCAWPTRPTF
jgi:Domain of unknown function (DUF6794)